MSLSVAVVADKAVDAAVEFDYLVAETEMGFEIDLFTPIFVMARIVGWTAHVAEQLADNRLVRPLADYVGAEPREVVPLEDR